MSYTQAERSSTTTGVYFLQEIVEERLRRLPAPFAELDMDEQAKFCADTEKYVNYELTNSDEAFTAMPIIAEAEGETGFLVEAHRGEPGLTVLRMQAAEKISGIIERAYIWHIAPFAVAVRSEATSLNELQVAVLLKLGQAVFESGGKEYPLDEHYDTYLPLTFPRLSCSQPDLFIL